jgi:hypothetical protein
MERYGCTILQNIIFLSPNALKVGSAQQEKRFSS